MSWDSDHDFDDAWGDSAESFADFADDGWGGEPGGFEALAGSDFWTRDGDGGGELERDEFERQEFEVGVDADDLMSDEDIYGGLYIDEEMPNAQRAPFPPGEWEAANEEEFGTDYSGAHDPPMDWGDSDVSEAVEFFKGDGRFDDDDLDDFLDSGAATELEKYDAGVYGDDDDAMYDGETGQFIGFPSGDDPRGGDTFDHGDEGAPLPGDGEDQSADDRDEDKEDRENLGGTGGLFG